MNFYRCPIADISTPLSSEREASSYELFCSSSRSTTLLNNRIQYSLPKVSPNAVHSRINKLEQSDSYRLILLCVKYYPRNGANIQRYHLVSAIFSISYPNAKLSTFDISTPLFSKSHKLWFRNIRCFFKRLVGVTKFYLVFISVARSTIEVTSVSSLQSIGGLSTR